MVTNKAPAINYYWSSINNNYIRIDCLVSLTEIEYVFTIHQI